MPHRHRLLAVSALASFVALVHACGGSAGPTPTPTAFPAPSPTPTPVNVEAVLQRSGEAMAGLKTFRFSLRHPSGATPLDLLPGLGSLEIGEADGAVVNPERLEARFGGALGSLYVESRLISVEGRSYLTNPLSGRWEEIPLDINPLAFFNPRAGIAAMMSSVHRASLTSESEDEYRMSGLILSEALAPLLGTTLTGIEVSVDLTIDRQTYRLLEARFEGRVTAGEEDGTTRVITLSDFDEPLVIEPPVAP